MSVGACVLVRLGGAPTSVRYPYLYPDCGYNYLPQSVASVRETLRSRCSDPDRRRCKWATVLHGVGFNVVDVIDVGFIPEDNPFPTSRARQVSR